MPPELLFILQHVDTISFLVLALFGHYKGVWVWGRDQKKAQECCDSRGTVLDGLNAENKAKLDKLEKDREIEWQIVQRERQK